MERVLVNSLKELIARGYKCDNGFKSGYMIILEQMMFAAFPTTDLRGEPHINSKMHVWKKYYGSLYPILEASGTGILNSQYKIDAEEDQWTDKDAKYLRNKEFPFYQEWKEIFGKDKATGTNSASFQDVVQQVLNNNNESTPSVGAEYVPETSPFIEVPGGEFQSSVRAQGDPSSNRKSKGKKRLSYEEADDRFNDNMKTFCDKTTELIVELTVHLGELTKRVGAKYDTVKKRTFIYETLEQFDFLAVTDKVNVSRYLCNNRNDLDFSTAIPWMRRRCW